MLPVRTPLAPVPDRVPSSFDAQGRAGGPRSACTALRSRAGGKMTPDAGTALGRLCDAVAAVGGDLRVTDCYRPTADQAAMRRRYEAWLTAGKPARSSPSYNASTMKADFVAKPGRSFHNAGRAVDLHTSFLTFPGLAADRVLDRLWELAIPTGWIPIIRAPTEGVSESWHFDYMGPWRPVADRLGYEQAAIGAVLDTGDDSAFPGPAGLSRRIQSGLQRAGYDIGDIDGDVGPRTRKGLGTAGYASTTVDLAAAMAFVDRLPDSARVVWRG